MSGLVYPVFLMIISLIIVIVTGLMTNTFSYKKILTEITGDLNGDKTIRNLRYNFEKALKYSQGYLDDKFVAIDGIIHPHIDPEIYTLDWNGNFFTTDDGYSIGLVDNGEFCAFKLKSMEYIEVMFTGECVEKIKELEGITSYSCNTPTTTATPGDVLNTVTYYDTNTNKTETGTMTCYNPSGNANADDVKSGVTFWNANTNQEETGTFACTVPTGTATAADVKKGVTFYNVATGQVETGAKATGFRIVYLGDISNNWSVQTNGPNVRTNSLNITTNLQNNNIVPSSLTASNFIQFGSGLNIGCNWENRSAGMQNTVYAYEPNTGIITRTQTTYIYNSAQYISPQKSPIIAVVPE